MKPAAPRLCPHCGASPVKSKTHCDHCGNRRCLVCLFPYNDNTRTTATKEKP